jgi:hypothetical protein
MAYTTINKSSDYFNTVTYTGDGNATQAITNTFQTDFSWIKHRGTTAAHTLQDAVRGFSESKKLSSNSTDAENNASGATWGDYGGVSAVGATSFTVYKGSQTPYQTNESGANYVAWNWKANGADSSNTDGSITSTVSANTTSGFSIVSYTGTGANATVGHGLGAVPKIIIVKNRSSSGDGWGVYHVGADPSIPQNKYLELNTTSAVADGTSPWNDTAPTSSVFTVGSWSVSNGSGNNMIAYCFAEKKGYSKFGSYTGNGNADGTFVYTGFKPAFVMIKNTTNGNNWFISDNKRVPFNLADDSLFPNSNSAEMTTQPTNYGLDILSNGMKMRTSGDHTANNNNASSNTYIYMAFAEAPLVGSNNVPCTAR